MNHVPENVDALLREAYRSVPVDEPDLERPVLNAIRTGEERAGEREVTDAFPSATHETSSPPPATATPPAGLGRWALRLYWLVAGIVSVMLIARAGAAEPGPLALAIAAAGTLPLWLAVRTLARVTGARTARLITRAL